MSSSPNSFTPTSPKRPGKIRRIRRNGIWAKGDVTGLSRTSRGSRHSGIWPLACCRLWRTVQRLQLRRWSGAALAGYLVVHSPGQHALTPGVSLHVFKSRGVNGGGELTVTIRIQTRADGRDLASAPAIMTSREYTHVQSP